MAWNEPGNNGGDNNRDPWGGNNNNNKNQGPPDLDEVLNNLSRKLGGLFGGKKPNNSNKSSNVGGFGISIIAVLLLVIWVASGFYTIREAERGVKLTFGQYDQLAGPVGPGLNWKATFIQDVIPVDVETIRSLPSSGFMLTKDENLVHVEMDVQYRVIDPMNYLFSVTAPDDSLAQATDSALRHVIGHTSMDDILTTGREVVRSKTWELIEEIVLPYNLGIQVIDVNFLPARPPEEVKDAFDDAIAAQEDEVRFIREAEAYEREIEPRARGQVQRIEQEAQAYKEQAVLRSEGEIAQFVQLLPQYEAAPEVTRHRLYMETMEGIYSQSSKVFLDAASNNSMIYLPIDKMMGTSDKSATRAPARNTNSVISEPRADSINSAPNRSSSARTSDRNSDRRG